MEHLNKKLYTDLAIDELDGRLAMETLEEKLEMRCWLKCNNCAFDPNIDVCDMENPW